VSKAGLDIKGLRQHLAKGEWGRGDETWGGGSSALGEGRGGQVVALSSNK